MEKKNEVFTLSEVLKEDKKSGVEGKDGQMDSASEKEACDDWSAMSQWSATGDWSATSQWSATGDWSATSQWSAT